MVSKAKLLLLNTFCLLATHLFAMEHRETIKVGNYVRDYILYLPPSLEGEREQTVPVPLVIAFHGHGGTAEGMERLTGFEAIAEKENFILVYPQGIERSWNDGRDKNDQINDTEFIDSLIKKISSSYPVDNKKIYAAGMSNGGFMCMRLACELSSKFAAVAAVGATIDSVLDSHCQTTIPVSVMLIHGNKDPLVPINGGYVKRLPESYILPHQSLVKKWVARNHCKTTPVTYVIPDINQDGTNVMETVYKGGINNSEVVSYVVENGGHAWPGGRQYLSPILIGQTTRNLDASDVIWEFFKSHTK